MGGGGALHCTALSHSVQCREGRERGGGGRGGSKGKVREVQETEKGGKGGEKSEKPKPFSRREIDQGFERGSIRGPDSALDRSGLGGSDRGGVRGFP